MNYKTVILGGIIFILALFSIFNGYATNDETNGEKLAKMQFKDHNVVLISIESLRTDHVGHYGYDRNTTYNIDKLADTGFVFTNAYSQAPWTHPSLISLLSSQNPTTHGVNRAHLLPKDGTKFMDVFLKNRGYATSAFVISAIPTTNTIFEPSFDEYQRTNSVDRITDWLKENDDDKFFMWIHFFKPHTPYKALPRYDKYFLDEKTENLRQYYQLWRPGKECDSWYYNGTDEDLHIKKALYDRCIKETDDRIGEIMHYFETNGLAENTIFIITSDHGEEFFDHGVDFGGGCDHGRTLYKPLINVPLIIQVPELEVSEDIPTRVRLIDIFPTVAELLGFEPIENIDGESMMPIMQGLESKDRTVIGGSLLNSDPDAQFIIDGNYKYIVYPQFGQEQLFDIYEDPSEMNNLIKEKRDIALRLMDKLFYYSHLSESDMDSVEFDKDTIEYLRSIGYLD